MCFSPKSIFGREIGKAVLANAVKGVHLGGRLTHVGMKTTQTLGKLESGVC